MAPVSTSAPKKEHNKFRKGEKNIVDVDTARGPLVACIYNGRAYLQPSDDTKDAGVEATRGIGCRESISLWCSHAETPITALSYSAAPLTPTTPPPLSPHSPPHPNTVRDWDKSKTNKSSGLHIVGDFFFIFVFNSAQNS